MKKTKILPKWLDKVDKNLSIIKYELDNTVQKLQDDEDIEKVEFTFLIDKQFSQNKCKTYTYQIVIK